MTCCGCSPVLVTCVTRRGLKTDLKVLYSGEGEGAGTGEDGQKVLSWLLCYTSGHHKLDGEVGTL